MKLIIFLILILLLLISLLKINNDCHRETFISFELPKGLKKIRGNFNKNKRKLGAILKTINHNGKDTFRNINRIIRN